MIVHPSIIIMLNLQPVDCIASALTYIYVELIQTNTRNRFTPQYHDGPCVLCFKEV